MNSMPIPQKTTPGGFTLLELMLVLILLSFIGILAVPMFSQAGQIRLGEAADQLAATIRYAQSASITDQQSYQVVISSETNSFEMRDSDGAAVVDPVNKAAAGSVNNLFSVNYTDNHRYGNISIDSAGFDDSDTLWFDSMGAPYSGTVLTGSPLVNGAIILRSGATTVTIQIEPVTGNVIVNP